VQLNRDQYGMRDRQSQSMSESPENVPSLNSEETASTSKEAVSVIHYTTDVENDESAQFISTIRGIFNQPASSFQQLSQSLPLSTLQKMLLAYNRFTEQRGVILSNRFIDGHPFELVKNELIEAEKKLGVGHRMTKTLAILNSKAVVKRMKTDCELMADLAMTFDPFASFSLEQKWLIYKKFWGGFMMLNRMYNIITYKEKAQFYNQPDCAKASDNTLMELVMKPFMKYMFSDKEYTALIGYIFWNLDTYPGIEPDIQAIGVKKREEIFDELHHYYVNEVGIANYAGRVAALIGMTGGLERFMNEKKEDILMLRVFDLLKQDFCLAPLID